MQNRRLLPTTLLALLSSGLFFGETSKVSVSAERRTRNMTNPNYALKLTTRVLNQRLCVGDSEVSTLVIRLRLHYSNESQCPIILYKGSNQAPSIMVSETATDALAGKLELSLSLTMLSSGKPEITRTQRLDDSFVVLAKGSSFETNSEIPIPFAVDDQTVPPGAIKKGEHVLQLKVITWPESLDLAKQLGAQWRDRGYLWHEVVQSEPMPFRIEQQAKLENCR